MSEAGISIKIKDSPLKRKSSYLRDNYELYLMLIPAALVYIIFRYLPTYGILIAFEDYNMFAGVFHSKWVGLDLFKEMFSTKTFWQVLINTIRLNMLSLIVAFPAPIIFALLLNEIRQNKFKRVVQAISYMPHFISWVILYGILLAFVSPDTGLFNVILTKLGFDQIKFLFEKSWWYVIYIGSGVWKEVGFSTIIYIAALSSISPELYEAAEIDGAGRFKKMWHVTLPGIRSTIVIMLLFSIGGVMSIGFDQPYLLSNAMVDDISDVLSTYIYRNGIQNVHYSYTTAVGLFQSVVNVILLISANKIASMLGESGLFGGKKK